MNNLLNYILVAFLVSHIAIAQQLGGTITDADSGIPLPGATVLVKGTTNGTTTDFDGLFQLDNVSSDTILVISYIGYETQEVAVNNNTNFTIALSTVADALEEIVVVGYGTQRKKEVTGAVSVLGAKAIEKLNPVRAEQALQGQIAGVNISSQSGSPGAGLNIRIRGITTNGNNAPLILVDGNRIGDLNALNPNDMEMLLHAPVYLMTNIYSMLMVVLKMMLVLKVGLRLGKAQQQMDVPLEFSLMMVPQRLHMITTRQQGPLRLQVKALTLAYQKHIILGSLPNQEMPLIILLILQRYQVTAAHLKLT